MPAPLFWLKIWANGGPTGIQLPRWFPLENLHNDDKLILYGFIAGFALNAVLAAQMVYYWNAPTKKSTKGKQKEKVVVPAPTGSTTATPKGKNPTTRRRG